MNAYYYLKRIGQLGFKGTLERAHEQIKRCVIYWYWRRRAEGKRAALSWEQLAQTHQISSDFSQFLTILKKSLPFEKILSNPLFTSLLPTLHNNTQVQQSIADKTVSRCFEILGSLPTSFEKGHIPWSTDFKPATAPTPSWQTPTAQSHYHADLTISCAQELEAHEYAPDIKVPWELSRLHHLVQLGVAYYLIKDDDSERARTYTNAFVEQLSDWHEQNSFMLGVNWMCPMDVAIRAVNIIWAFHYFKDDPSIPESFWQQIICSLHNHAVYLENHWETSATPNNHYLADLVGYYYLSTFFGSLKQFKTQHQAFFNRLCTAFDQQILDDGTCYEGTTSYHRLDSEFLLHVHQLALLNNDTLTHSLEKKLLLMIEFMELCQEPGGSTLQIGDNDSGKLLFGLTTEKKIAEDIRYNQLKHYSNFGLSIIDNGLFRVSYRHPTYTQRQPSGHFHNDHLVITVNYHNKPFIVDPGTFVYTANPRLRNSLRGASQHSTFYASCQNSQEKLWDANPTSTNLFTLPRTVQADTARIINHQHSIDIINWHGEYAAQSLYPYRGLIVDDHLHTVLIEDWWEQAHRKQSEEIDLELFQSHWNLVFHPDVIIEQLGELVWKLTNDSKQLVLTTNLHFSRRSGFFSPAYGRIAQTSILTAHDRLTKRAFIHLKPE